MKKCASVLFYSALFLLFSCNGGKQPAGSHDGTRPVIKSDTLNISEDYRLAANDENSPVMEIDITMPVIELSDQVATANINSTLASVIFDGESDLRAACDSFIVKEKENYDEIRYLYTPSDEDYFGARLNWFFNIKGSFMSGYKDYITYFIYYSEYTGGAHPNGSTLTYCFDPATGNEITLDSLFRQGYEEPLTATLTTELMQHANVNTMEELLKAGYLYFNIDMFISNNIILGNDSITFLYNPYEIAPYSYGDIALTIDYETLKDIMK